jgi:antirestriction protein
MDHEGFEGLLDGECSPMEARRLGELYDEIERAGYPVGAVAAWRVETESEDLDDFADEYQGEYESEVDFAQETAESIGAIPEDASWPTACIDWEQAARELMMDYASEPAPGGRVWIFRR